MKLKSAQIVFAWLTLASTTLVNLHARSPQYNITFLDPTDTSFSESASISAFNNQQQIVGAYNAPYPYHEMAFCYANGVLANLGTLGGSLSQAQGINSQGQIVGHASTDIGVGLTHAFLYVNNTLIDLGTAVGPNGESAAYAINEKGQIVGNSESSYSGGMAALFWEGKITLLGSLIGDSGASVAYSINNNDTDSSTGIPDIVGASTYSNNSNFYHAFLIYSNGTMKDIGREVCPEYDNISYAIEINDSRKIIGFCFTSDGSLGYIYDAATGTYDSMSAGFIPSDINNQDNIVGTYSNSTMKYDIPYLYLDGETYFLFDIIPADSGLIYVKAIAINDNNQIVATTNKGVVLFTPIY